jgi:hypothetical protein
MLGFNWSFDRNCQKSYKFYAKSAKYWQSNEITLRFDVPCDFCETNFLWPLNSHELVWNPHCVFLKFIRKLFKICCYLKFWNIFIVMYIAFIPKIHLWIVQRFKCLGYCPTISCSIPVTGQTKFRFFQPKTFSGHDSRGLKRSIQMFFSTN